jgi:hypothetical protein
VNFYKDLMKFLGWSILYEDKEVLGLGSGDRQSMWFGEALKKGSNDYDKTGVNHISIRIEQQQDIDEIVSYLKSHNIKPLFDTPRHRPEFAANENETYYQVMFESPDKILFEVVYVGLKK